MLKNLTFLIFTISSIQFLNGQSLVKQSGLAYFDYFYNISRKDNSMKDLNGFQFRRVFYTVDFDVTNKLSTRFRVDADAFDSNNRTRYYTFLKDVYFQYKFSNVILLAGLIPTPQLEIEERYWGYRSIEKIQSDYRDLVSSRDVGIAFRGNFSSSNLNYWIMLGNNNSHGFETEKYKRLYLQVVNKFSDILSASFDFNFANARDNKNYLYSRIGFYFSQNQLTGGFTASGGLKQKSSPSNSDLKILGLSLFGNLALAQDLKSYLRFDLYDPNINKALDMEYTLFAGLDYKLEKNLSIIPNLIFNYYENRNNSDDLIARVTFYYQF